ncbi:MAG: hypothetical protein FWE62_02360, partial [Firmicutes bacterium]|nr:hypothetical protein [Bacillota bacterium]
MFLKDLLLNTGIDTKKIMMVRHSLNHERVAGNFKADELAIAKGKPPRCLEFYQRIQNKFVFAKYDYVLTFISAEGTTAVYYGCYKIDGYLDMTEHRADAIKLLPEDYFVKDGNRDEEIRHEALWDLKRITMAPNGAPVLENMENRLVIDWTGRFWFKKEALRRVKISYIKLEISKYQFASYDKVLLTLEQLCHIVKN